ncbi:MAG: hypothetical protein JO189_15605 [Deltaproteobacteria bacterium]|nr:hypothetical protein [Deltaproteobacteria bacterium]
MEKAKARATSVKKRSGKGVPAKKSTPRSARTRSSQQPVAARAKADKDNLAGVLTDLVEISIEIRELLTQIRDALVEREEAEPDEVDTVVITEAENPEPSEDEI